MSLFGFLLLLWSPAAEAGETYKTKAEIADAKAQFAACPMNTIHLYFKAISDQDEVGLLRLMTPEMQERSTAPRSFRSAFFSKGADFEKTHGKITYLGHRFIKVDRSKEKPMYLFEILMGFEKNGTVVARVEPIKFVFEGDLIDIAG